MDYIEKPAAKPPLSSIRERFTLLKLAQVEAAQAQRLDELQRSLRRGLSPDLIDQKQFELDALRDLRSNLRNQLEVIAQQSVAALGSTDEDYDTPQQVGPYRTQRAYFDNLQRERAKLAPLSRATFERAKEASAKRTRKGKRRGIDIDPDTLFAREHPTWFTQPGQVRSYMYAKETLTGIDPCLEAKKVRREVMFAQRTAGIGYRTRHEWKPC